MTDDNFDQLKQAYKDDNHKVYGDTGHAMKGMFLNLCLGGLCKVGKEAETTGRTLAKAATGEVQLPVCFCLYVCLCVCGLPRTAYTQVMNHTPDHSFAFCFSLTVTDSACVALSACWFYLSPYWVLLTYSLTDLRTFFLCLCAVYSLTSTL